MFGRSVSQRVTFSKLPGLRRLPAALVCVVLLTGTTAPVRAAAHKERRIASNEPAASATASAFRNVVLRAGAAEPSEEKYAYRIDNFYYGPQTGWHWFGFFGAISILALVIFAGWQIFFIRKLAKEIAIVAQAVRQSAEATANLATATLHLANLERPWIIISKKALAAFPLEEDSVMFPLTLEIQWELANVGRSPALVTDLSTAIVCAPVMDLGEPAYGNESPSAGEFLVPPGGDYAASCRKEIHQRDYADLLKRNLCIAFYGRILYHDPTRLKPHVTRFFYRWYIDRNGIVLDNARPGNYIEYS